MLKWTIVHEILDEPPDGTCDDFTKEVLKDLKAEDGREESQTGKESQKIWEEISFEKPVTLIDRP